MTRALAFAVVVLALGAAFVAVPACGASSHIFVGRLYSEERGCLGPKTSVDVVSGEPPGECAPTCLVQRLADGGSAIYVATMCAPYPHGFDVSGADPACASALAALERGDACFTDGGSSRPAEEEPSDAGAD